MANFDKRQAAPGARLEPTEARQGSSRHTNLRVLIISTAVAALVGLIFVTYFMQATSPEMDASSAPPAGEATTTEQPVDRTVGNERSPPTVPPATESAPAPAAGEPAQNAEPAPTPPQNDVTAPPAPPGNNPGSGTATP